MGPDLEKALVVDDDVSIRLMLARVLERNDFSVDTARDGVEALEKISHENFDIIFLDMMMPRIDGIGVIRHLRSHSPDTLKNVIVMTAFNKVADEVSDKDDIPHIIGKPFDIGDLVQHAREIVSHRGLEAVPSPEPAAEDETPEENDQSIA